MNDALEVVQALMCCACNNPDHHDAAAVLAAASGPWAEQLDTAGWRTEAYDARKQIAGLAAERDAALARNAELEERLTAWTTSNTAAVKAYETASAERDALRAELDNLRDVPAECDNGQANTCRHDSASGMDASFGPGKVWRCDHCGLCWIEGYSPHDPRAAIVRGSDDEEKP